MHKIGFNESETQWNGNETFGSFHQRFMVGRELCSLPSWSIFTVFIFLYVSWESLKNKRKYKNYYRRLAAEIKHNGWSPCTIRHYSDFRTQKRFWLLLNYNGKTPEQTGNIPQQVFIGGKTLTRKTSLSNSDQVYWQVNDHWLLVIGCSIRCCICAVNSCLCC